MNTQTKTQEPEWITGTPKQLLAALNPGGWAWGHSGRWPDYLRLHKTDLICNLRKLPADHPCIWKIIGDPNMTGQHGRNRRTVLVWLGE